MLTYHAADPAAMDRYWQLMQVGAAGYLAHTLELMEMTPAGFRYVFEITGEVIGILQDGEEAGFYWIEERESVVHLHALIVAPNFRGQGIGTAALHTLITRYQGTHDAIELGVHESNPRARALYERLGFRTVQYLDDLGFYVMQRALSEDAVQEVNERGGQDTDS